MITALFLAIALGIWGWEWLQSRNEYARDQKRREEVLALRQRYIGLRGDDPTAQEQLGDALRQAGYPGEAVAAYATAERLYAEKRLTAGANLPHKIRLTRMELLERERPERYNQTLDTRESVCRRCGTLNLPHVEACTHCGAALLVGGFWETLTKNSKMRGEVLAEIRPFLVKWAVVMAAIAFATFMPDEIRFSLLIAGIIVVPFAVLKQLGDPTLDG